jgi:Zn-dependent peptidase ImmA (M78 family)
MTSETADYQNAKSEAIRLLRKYSITSPPVNLVDIADGEGLNISIAEFKEGDVSGFIDLDQKIIFVNKNDSPARQRFTIAHELGHWVLHRSKIEADRDIVVLYRKALEEGESDILEQEANCFAANLLVPSDFFSVLASVPLSNKTMANIFLVSESVILYRGKFP